MFAFSRVCLNVSGHNLFSPHFWWCFSARHCGPGLLPCRHCHFCLDVHSPTAIKLPGECSGRLTLVSSLCLCLLHDFPFASWALQNLYSSVQSVSSPVLDPWNIFNKCDEWIQLIINGTHCPEKVLSLLSQKMQLRTGFSKRVRFVLQLISPICSRRVS